MRVIERIQELQEELSLTETWRAKNPYTKEYTWEQPNPKVQCRLDMWFTPIQWFSNIKSCKIVLAVLSDHKAVTLTLQGGETKDKGPGLWKLNNQFLTEHKFQMEVVEKGIQAAVADYEDADPRYVWDAIKYEIRKRAIKYGKERAKKSEGTRKESRNTIKTT